MLENSVSPKISVLIPVYNVEKYVERCILSVLGQTMQEGVEVIIVNDCTPDRSMEIIHKILHVYLKENKMKFRIVEHDTNQGSGVTRNTLMANAKGNYTIYIDSDDYIEPDMLEEMYKKAIEEDADIVGCNIILEYPQKREEWVYDNDSLMRIGGVYSSLCNKLIRRSLYIEHNISSFNISMWEDTSVTFRLRFFSKKTVVIPKGFYHYIVGENDNSICKNYTIKNLEEQIVCAKKLEEFIRQQGKENEYKLVIANLKFRSKSALFSNSALVDYKHWRTVYSESNRYIWRFNYLPVYQRVYYILVMYHLTWIAVFLIKLEYFVRGLFRN